MGKGRKGGKPQQKGNLVSKAVGSVKKALSTVPKGVKFATAGVAAAAVGYGFKSALAKGRKSRNTTQKLHTRLKRTILRRMLVQEQRKLFRVQMRGI